MKIAILCNSKAWGGLEINISKLAVWLAERKNEILFIAPDNSDAKGLIASKDIEFLAFESQYKYGNLFKAMALAKTLKKRNISYIISSHSKDINLMVICKKLLNNQIKTIYIQQMVVGIIKKDLLHNIIYSNLDAWVAPLQSIANETLNNTNLKEKKIHIIPLAINVDVFLNAKLKQKEARKAFNLDENAFWIGTIGRLDPGKGQEFTIKAIKILKDKGYMVKGLIVGDETKGDVRAYPQYLKQLTQDLDLENHISFRPFTENPEMAFACLDVFVMSSLAETYGMVTLEAMASGIPVVGGKAGGTVDLIRDYETGIFYEPENENDLANKVELLINDNELRQKLEKQGILEVKNKYSHHIQCEMLESLLQNL
jgi:glycosyltransferase involved in cell wall biosynthesis